MNNVQLMGVRMARRSDHSREELYELVLAAATEIVETDGFRALTARNVADAIGYSAGTLYNLFANLDDLILHINGRTLDRVYDRLSREKLTGMATQDISNLLNVYLRFIEAHPNLWAQIFEHNWAEDDVLPQWYLRKIDKGLSILENALTPIFSKNSEAEIKNAARVLWAGLHGIVSLSTSGKLEFVSNESVADMAKSLASNYVAGLVVQQEMKRPDYA